MADEQDTEPEVRLTIVDGVAEIVLDGPKVMNAISARPGGTRDQLLAALTAAEADPTAGCVLLRAEGKNSCGGGDLTGNARRETAGEDLLFLETADAFHDRLRASRLPVVAAVQGYGLGAGLTLASCCDFVIAGATARFAYPEDLPLDHRRRGHGRDEGGARSPVRGPVVAVSRTRTAPTWLFAPATIA